MHTLSRLMIRATRKFIVPLLPLKHRLPLRYQAALLLSECESELRHLSEVIRSRKTAIDVGANAGMYAYKLSQDFEQVVAFEINDELTTELTAYNPGNIKIINKGLSSRVDHTTLYIPIVNDRPLTGWASLQLYNHPDAQEHIEKQVEVCQLDSFNIQDVSFIKIDVEGHEMEVLKGGYETIKTCRPHLMIEIREENLSPVTDFFQSLNYKICHLQDLIGVPGSSGNYFFIPN